MFPFDARRGRARRRGLVVPGEDPAKVAYIFQHEIRASVLVREAGFEIFGFQLAEHSGAFPMGDVQLDYDGMPLNPVETLFAKARADIETTRVEESCAGQVEPLGRRDRERGAREILALARLPDGGAGRCVGERGGHLAGQAQVPGGPAAG